MKELKVILHIKYSGRTKTFLLIVDSLLFPFKNDFLSIYSDVYVEFSRKGGRT